MSRSTSASIAWVTPLLKGYNRPAERLAERTGGRADGRRDDHCDPDGPAAIGIAGLGLVEAD
jgi:hypothetical protein